MSQKTAKKIHKAAKKRASAALAALGLLPFRYRLRLAWRIFRGRK